MRVSRQGVDALSSNDPNAYIFHSDLNTFKIVTEGTAALNYSGTAYQTFNILHGSNLGTPTAYAIYMKFPDGKTMFIPGNGQAFSFDSNWNVIATSIDGTAISTSVQGTGAATIPLKYYVFETPL